MHHSTVTVTGNLAREPEIRYTRAGVAQTTISVADSWTEDVIGEPEPVVMQAFVEVLTTGDMAENVALSFSKGTRVTVTGHFVTRAVTIDGTETTRTVVLAHDVAASVKHGTVEFHGSARS
jgi:single-strand DNA-binding protein